MSGKPTPNATDPGFHETEVDALKQLFNVLYPNNKSLYPLH